MRPSNFALPPRGCVMLAAAIGGLAAMIGNGTAVASTGVTGTAVTSPDASRSADLDLSAYRGRVVYLDFWASWCGPCRASFPWMDTLQANYGPRGLAVIGLDVDRHRAEADRFLASLTPQFTIAFDPAGVLAERFHVNGMPESLLIDRKGRVRYQHIGYRPEDQLAINQQVRELLAEAP